jgi:hypothetical protein
MGIFIKFIYFIPNLGKCLCPPYNRRMAKYLSLQGIGRYAAVYLLYLGIAILITYPLITVMSTQMAGDNSGDAYETARHIWWYKHALQTGQPLFYQPLLAYPDGIPSMYLWAIPLRTFPGWLFAFFMPLPAAFNLMLLLRLALNGAAMCWTAYQFTCHRGAALVAGTIFLTFPAMQGHLLGAHVDLLALWAAPLYVWSLFQLVHHKGTEDTENTKNTEKQSEGTQYIVPLRAIMLSALLFVLSLLGSFVLLVYVLFPITAVFVLWRLKLRDWRGALHVVIAAAAGGVLSLIFVLPGVLELLSMPALHEGGSVRFSADLLAFASPSFFHPVYQSLGYNRQVLGINLIEGSGYLGIIAGALAVIGVWRAKTARWWLALACVAWVFSLGPLLNINGVPATLNIGGEYQTYIPLPWALFQALPVLDISRTPGRFNFVVGMCMAIMAAYGIVAAWEWMRRWTVSESLRRRISTAVALGILIAFIVFDYQSFFPLPTVQGDIPAAIAALGQRGDVRAVFNIPWDNLLVAKEALYLQTAHGLPLIAGQVTRQTPVDPAKLRVLQATLDRALLRDAGADVVIVHRAGLFDADSVLFNRAQQVLGTPIYQDARFAVFDVPPQTALPWWIGMDGVTHHNFAENPFYANETGWLVTYSVAMASSGGQSFIVSDQQITLALDGQPFATGSGWINTVLPIAQSGYHTVTVTGNALCVEGALCPTISIDIGDYQEQFFFTDQFDTSLLFDQGISLAGSYIWSIGHFHSVDIFLWWQFSQPIPENSVRFVHVVDENGEKIAQSDETLSADIAERSERISLAFPSDWAPYEVAGTYRVYVGWYTYPDLTRFPILSGGADERAQDGLAYIGSFTLESP